MKTCALLALCLLCLPLGAQTTTPNIGLEIPVTGGQNWQAQLNFNWNLLDSLLANISNLQGQPISSTPATENQFLLFDGTHYTPTTIPAVAKTGSYNDLSDKPSIPTAVSIDGDTGSFTFSGSVTHIGNAYTFSSEGGSMIFPTGDGIPVVSDGTSWGTTRAAPTGTIVGTTDMQTMTNKTVDGVTPTTFGFLDPTSSVQTQLNGKQASLGFTAVPNTRTVNGHALSADIMVAPADLAAGALANGMTGTTQAPDDVSNKLATDAYVWGQGVGGRTVSGTTDAITSADHGQSVLYTSSSDIAVALPDPSTLNSHFVFVASARTGSGLITFTAAAGGFLNSSDGSATTQILTPGQTCSISSPDNTNYLARCAAAPNLARFTVATLPSASAWGAGAQVLVTDASSFTPGTCTGSGDDTMIAVSDGSSWSCH